MTGSLGRMLEVWETRLYRDRRNVTLRRSTHANSACMQSWIPRSATIDLESAPQTLQASLRLVAALDAPRVALPPLF